MTNPTTPNEPLTLERRRAILDQFIAREVTQGRTVMDRTDVNAVLTARLGERFHFKRPPYLTAWIIGGFFTYGIAWIGLLVYGMEIDDARFRVHVDERGNLTSPDRTAKRVPEVRAPANVDSANSSVRPGKEVPDVWKPTSVGPDAFTERI